MSIPTLVYFQSVWHLRPSAQDLVESSPTHHQIRRFRWWKFLLQRFHCWSESSQRHLEFHKINSYIKLHNTTTRVGRYSSYLLPEKNRNLREALSSRTRTTPSSNFHPSSSFHCFSHELFACHVCWSVFCDQLADALLQSFIYLRIRLPLELGLTAEGEFSQYLGVVFDRGLCWRK